MSEKLCESDDVKLLGEHYGGSPYGGHVVVSSKSQCNV